MVFTGYFGLNGAELANTARLIAHINPGIPTSDSEVGALLSCACDLEVGYDDSWPGLPATLGHDPYVITNAPWYDAARPESAEFAGIWVMDVQGVDAVPVARTVNEAICSGGVAGLARDKTRTLTFSALLVACSNAGFRFGLNWLACRLRSANARQGALLDLWSAHPSGTAASAASLRRTMRGLVLTSAPAAVEVAAKGNEVVHRQASVFRVEWEMVATSPYLYGTGTTLPVVWDTTAAESITWAHAPNCTGPGSCDLPTIFNADCLPPDVPIDLAAPPTCGGCLPLCSITRRTWEMPAVGSSCNETVVSVRVTNTDVDNLTVNMVWRPCGSTDTCDEVYPLQVSGLAPGDVAVADSVTGRPYVESDGVAHRQVGVVSTQRGAPWSPMVIDTGQCWELVAESAPGASYTVEIVLQGRDA